MYASFLRRDASPRKPIGYGLRIVGIAAAKAACMRHVLLAAAALSVVSAAIACSSAQPVTGEDGLTEDAGSTALPSNDSTKNDTVTTPTPVADLDAGTDSGATLGPGVLTTEGDAGSQCLTDSLREVEGNNDLATANVLPSQTASFCGRVTAGDVDVVKFKMPDQVGMFSFAIERTTSRQIQVQPSVDGEEFSIFSNNYPFKPGGEYAFKISSSNNTTAFDYRIRITIEQ